MKDYHFDRAWMELERSNASFEGRITHPRWINTVSEKRGDRCCSLKEKTTKPLILQRWKQLDHSHTNSSIADTRLTTIEKEKRTREKQTDKDREITGTKTERKIESARRLSNRANEIEREESNQIDEHFFC